MSDFSQLPPVEYETRDVSARSITRTAGIVAGAVVVSALVSWGFFEFLRHEDAAQRAPVPSVARHEPFREPPAPRLQRVPFDDVRDLRRAEDAILKEYAWVEPGRVARIPIAEAMRLYVERAQSGHASSPFTLALTEAVVPVRAASPAPEVQR